MSEMIATLAHVSQQITIYLSIPMLSAGVIGGLLTIIVFLSLRIFRESSCAYYLLAMSCVNIGQLLTGQLSRIMIGGYNVDWTQTSQFYCKFRWFAIQTCTLTSYACLCFATIDQFLATSSRPHWQQWSNIKVARILCAVAFIFSLCHGILVFFVYDHHFQPETGRVTCIITSSVYFTYYLYFYLLVLSGLLPVSITILFGFLAYRNVQNIAHRTIPLVRREHDKQLSTMVFIQAAFSFLAILLYPSWIIVTSNIDASSQPVLAAEIQFGTLIVSVLYYVYFASPFYIYISVSERFRHQLFYVLTRVFRAGHRQPVAPNTSTGGI